jgi:hypothetical protein
MLPSALSRRYRRRPAGASPPRHRAFRPGLEALEDRLVPTTWPVINPADNGAANTLRWAVAQANKNNGDAIDIQTAQPIVLTQGELLLTRNVVIFGPPNAPYGLATISGGNRSRVFEVAPTASVDLTWLEIIDGNGEADLIPGSHWFDGDGGAILNEGRLDLRGCLLDHNSCPLEGYSAFSIPAEGRDDGGAVCNVAPPYADTTGGFSGRLYASGCQLFSNTASFGGAIANLGGLVQIGSQAGGCELDNNSAWFGGGAIANENLGAGPKEVDVGWSYVESNTAQGVARYTWEGGGGISNDFGCVLYVGQTQLYGNRDIAWPGTGGGIWNAGGATVWFSELEYNSAVFGGGMYNSGYAQIESCDFWNNTATSQLYGGPSIYTVGGSSSQLELVSDTFWDGPYAVVGPWYGTGNYFF